MATEMEAGMIKLPTYEDLEEVVVVNGESWKCPIYVRRMPPCKSSCPSNEDIRGYLTYLAQSESYKRSPEEALDYAWYTITDKNPFPAIHGRICPHPCEDGCNRQHKDESVAINNMERVVGDHGLARGLKLQMLTEEKKDKKIAVIGAGPSGLSAAYQMARRGYQVTVFESAQKPGGMLRYGIPSYRLPREILDAEIQNILDLGVELKCNTKVGSDITYDELKERYDAIYVGVGAQVGSNMGVEGESLPGVYSGVEFLRQINEGQSVDLGKKVAIIGGGNTAMDAARVSRRLGADVTLLYRRTKNEMPAIKHEIVAAEEEGVVYELLTAPVSIAAKDGGGLIVKCIRMELGEKDSSGRQRPVPVEGSEFEVEVDSVIAAVGQQPDLDGMNDIANEWGWAKANALHQTAVAGVFAGGDALNLDIATTAVGHGRKAAQAMNSFLKGEEYRAPDKARPVKHTEMRLSYYPELPRNNEPELSVAERLSDFVEVSATLTLEAAVAEAERCMSCGLCFTCDQCRVFCPREAIHRDKKRPQGEVMFTDYTLCNGCHVCAQSCPCAYIEMGLGL